MRERTSVLAVVGLAAAVFFGLQQFVRSQQAAAFRRIDGLSGSTTEPAGEPPARRPLAHTAQLLRDLKLVTVEVRTRVESSRLDTSWRGDVRASVTAPVRLIYGCDLSGIGEEPDPSRASIRPDLLGGGYVLRVPRPERIAAEIDGPEEQADVQVGWGRFRDLAGEFQLGLARSALAGKARSLALSPAQQEELERTTRRQLTTLVRALAAGGEPVPVHVEFFDPPGDRIAGAEATGGGR